MKYFFRRLVAVSIRPAKSTLVYSTTEHKIISIFLLVFQPANIFYFVYLPYSSRQSLATSFIALIFRIQKRRDEDFGKLRSNDATTQAEHIHIIVQNALRRRIGIMANRSVD